MFLKFKTAEEIQEYGGSAFIEIQYCKLPVKTSNKKIVSVQSIENWNLSSLYIYHEDMNDFYVEYKEIFKNGLYNNMNEGVIDLFGINYYNTEKTKDIINALKYKKPKEFEILFQWLTDNPYNNGFYILGL